MLYISINKNNKRYAVMKKTLLTLSALTVFSLSAEAVTEQKEMQVVGKVAGFANSINKAAPVKLGVIVDSTNATSQTDFDAVKSIVGTGLKAGKVTLEFVPVGLSEISSKASSVDMLFVTEGLADKMAEINTVAKENKKLTVSTDMSCVETGNCLVGVDVSSGVKVFLNRASVDATGIEFDSAFKFMVKEL